MERTRGGLLHRRRVHPIRRAQQLGRRLVAPRENPPRSPTASPGGESLRGHSHAGSYGGLDGPAGPGSRTSGGVYDRARKPPNHPVARNAVQIAALDASKDPQTRAAIRQYKRYRARTSTSTHLDQVRGLPDAYSAGVSAFGGKDGRGLGSAFGSELGNPTRGNRRRCSASCPRRCSRTRRRCYSPPHSCSSITWADESRRARDQAPHRGQKPRASWR